MLALAAEREMVLVSHDVTTMQDHFLTFTKASESPGLLLIPQRVSTKDAIEGLLYAWESLTTREMLNQIRFLPRRPLSGSLQNPGS